MKFLNETLIIEVKQDRNHEYPKSNDSTSTPEFRTRPTDSLSNSATFIPYKLNQKDNLSPAFRKAFTNELLLVIIRSVIIHDSVKENIIP